MLELCHVSTSVNNKQILDDISFCLPENKITVVLGKNGSGKSTLIRCINQFQKYEGDISLDGVSLSTMNVQKRSRYISILPQILPQTPLSVYDLFRTGLQPGYMNHKLSRADERSSIESILAAADLTGKANQTVSSLSGGEQRRVFLRMILARNTPIKILDEPMGSLDINVRKEIADSVIQSRNEGSTFLLVLHDLEEAIRLGDYFVILDQGVLCFAGSKEACLSEKAIERAFQVHRHPISDDSFSGYFFL